LLCRHAQLACLVDNRMLVVANGTRLIPGTDRRRHHAPSGRPTDRHPSFSRLKALRLDYEPFRTDAELLIAGIEQVLPEAGPHLEGPARGVAAAIPRPRSPGFGVAAPGRRDVAPLRARDELVAEVNSHVIGDSAVGPQLNPGSQRPVSAHDTVLRSTCRSPSISWTS
jgi:hypothetical protein